MPQYGWQIRVLNTARFLQRIAPVLEQRLARNERARHSGALRMRLYSETLELDWQDG